MTDILVVCGLKREAALVAGSGVTVVAGGGDRRALEARLAALAGPPFAAIVSFGLAGALVDGLRPGDVVVPSTVYDADGRSFPVHARILAGWRASLSVPPPSGGDLFGSDVALLGVGAKREAAERGAVAVDMESHVAAAYSARRGIPFAVLRAISDPSDRDLPHIAGRAMRPDGTIDVMGVVRGLLRDPAQLPALVRTARDAEAGFRSLGRVRRLLGPRLGLHLG